VYANHILEHLDDLEAILAEIHRVVKPEGRIRLFVPHFSNPYGYSDYTHRRMFGLFTFRYFTPPCLQMASRPVPNYQSLFWFKVTHERLRFHSPLVPIWPLVVGLELVVNSSDFVRAVYEYHFCHWFPIYGIQVEIQPIGKHMAETSEKPSTSHADGECASFS
jgi:SAM-dependent methyltransferase